MIQRALKQAGIKKAITAHGLRHSFASNLIGKGVDVLRVQKLLGHESIVTTNIYLHTNMDDLQSAVDLL
jgi:site-specific recombinase XerD